jgi:hypothetical protein
MINDNRTRGQWIQCHVRVQHDEYPVPFFTDLQMENDLTIKRVELIDRMDGAQFKFLETRCLQRGPL